MFTEEFAMIHLFDKTPDLVCVVNKEGWFQKINPAVCNTLGYTEEELLARPVSVHIHPDDRERTRLNRDELLKGNPLLNFQNRYLGKDGTVVWLEWTSVYLPEKEIVFAIAKNITKRKVIEIEIEDNYKKYKQLTTHFKEHIEKDRQLFATELHEQLAQLATVVKMDLEWIASHGEQLEAMISKRAEHGLEAAAILIDKIRDLSYAVDPQQIHDLGLDAAFKNLCSSFSLNTGIRCKYKGSFREEELPPEVKLDLFRICQEALLNIMNHANATEVEISLKAKKGKLQLSVTDNGNGFELKAKQNFGLKDMQHRADSINGELLIETKKNKGTSIHVTVSTG